MTPAERLRGAADLIEHTAADATPGPWKRKSLDVLALYETEYRLRIATAPYVAGDAAWIALLGPDTAPALAAWLRAEADRTEDADDRWYPHALAEALAFADLILRGQ